MNLLYKIKNQSYTKLAFICINVIRIFFLKLIYGARFRSSIIQNWHPSTNISIREGQMHLSRSVFTRRNVTFCVDQGILDIGTSFFNEGCAITCLCSIKIGNNCLFGPHVVVVDHDHDYHFPDTRRGHEYIRKSIIIGNNVVVGANTTILKGTIIEDNVVIGAGSVVSGHITKDTMYYVEHKKVEKKIRYYKIN